MTDTERYDFGDVHVIRHQGQYAVWMGEKLIEWTLDLSAAVVAFVDAVKATRA